jgi:hypothetical protein
VPLPSVDHCGSEPVFPHPARDHPARKALKASLLPIIALAVVVASAVGAQGAEQAAVMTRGCRGGDPLAGVHHPSRLKIVKRCVAATGSVVWARAFPDGDFKFNLRLDPGGEYLLNEHNHRDQGDALVCEIIPADQPGCTPGQPVKVPLGIFQRVEAWFQGPYEFGVCTGANIALPPPGARVRVVGPNVIDMPHGWAEIHPVWSVEILSPPPTR